MTARLHDGVALVPSPMPTSLAATDRMCAILGEAGIPIHEGVPIRSDVDASVLDAGAPDDASRRLMLIDSVQSNTMVPGSAINPPPVEVLIEATDETPDAWFEEWSSCVRTNDIFWSLSTEAAMRMPAPSQPFADAVVRRIDGGDSGDLRMRIETALHETVANALVHGNLGLPSLSKLEGDDQSDTYQRAIQAGLSDRARACRRVELSACITATGVTIRVRDEGDGVPEVYWRESLNAGDDALTHAEKSGRGLYLTAMFCDNLRRADAGRTVELCFETGPETPAP